MMLVGNMTISEPHMTMSMIMSPLAAYIAAKAVHVAAAADIGRMFQWASDAHKAMLETETTKQRDKCHTDPAQRAERQLFDINTKLDKEETLIGYEGSWNDLFENDYHRKRNKFF